ncbi:PXA domain-containing protein [Blumeria hordei DH14]|uniref:PXA domain-containing protein n=1 Tax=Blumeria graminis f. sp. hordei (strain DH14) TaxID=546991 RepID=N1J761_BLUG1|nr:PXA domain-containing protein [Blumeria hordei DH14]
MSRPQDSFKTSTVANNEPSIPPSCDLLSNTPSTTQRTTSKDSPSDRATLFFVRRTLCSQLGDKHRCSPPAPINEILPPLTSSNEIDLQLYACIAILFREYVQTWYHKITPDQTFVDELVKIIAHCTRALEQRLRKVDLESLLFDEIPELLDAHIQAHRISYLPLHPPPLSQNSRQIYHSLTPLPALSPVPGEVEESSAHRQAENESAYRQLLSQGVLALLLPTEDLENDCLVSIVSELVSETLLGLIGKRAAEPWQLWEGIAKLAGLVKPQIPTNKARERNEQTTSEDENQFTSKAAEKETINYRALQTLQKYFWTFLQCGYLAFTMFRLFFHTISSASSLPSRSRQTLQAVGTNNLCQKEISKAPHQKHQQVSSKQPIVAMKIWTCAARLIDLDARMPWLAAFFSMLQWTTLTGPGQIGKTDGIIDKFLSHAIRTHVLAPTALPEFLKMTRTALFPNNMLAPPRIAPDASESLAIRRQCAEALLNLIPARIREIYFGPGWEKMVREMEASLDVLGDSYCNKHLMYSLVDLVVVRLMPELAESGVEALLAERLH